MEKDYIFPEGFRWGSATSAWQIEGGLIKNEYYQMHREGKIAGGADPAEAAGFWKFYERDIALMKQMNHKSFRMSVEWARVEPEEGRFDEEAIQHYRKIIHAVKDAGIMPVVDLLHHSSPLWLYKHGDWTNFKAVEYLRRFAEKVVSQTGDMVDVWLTVNEPTMWAAEAYLDGVLHPYKHSFRLFFKSMDVFAKAHVALYELINEIHARKNWQRPTVGFAHAVHGIDPFNPGNPLDKIAARQVHQILEERFINMIMKRGRTIDIMGINYYFCLRIKSPLSVRASTDLPLSKEGWPIDPHGFHRVLEFAWKKYRLPIWIMENGIGEDDDELRPRFLLDHLYHMHRAISAGADVRAYHHWATMDTLEYHKGYGIKYGLIKVDMETKEKTRTLRNSGKMYGEIAAANGITRGIVEKYVPDWTPDSFPDGYNRIYGHLGKEGLF